MSVSERFDLVEIQKMNNGREELHFGLTLAMGGPFDNQFKNQIEKEQQGFNNVFSNHHLEKILCLYDLNSVHATLIALEGEPADKVWPPKRKLSSQDLIINFFSGGKMDLNFVLEWAENQQSFEVELGPEVLREDRKEQVIRVTSNGLIVMKGRAAKDRTLLAKIRADLEDKANIKHKYGREDDEFFFVIGYLKPNKRLNDSDFITALENYLSRRRKKIKMLTKITSVKVFYFSKTTLRKDDRIKELKLRLREKSGVSDLLKHML